MYIDSRNLEFGRLGCDSSLSDYNEFESDSDEESENADGMNFLKNLKIGKLKSDLQSRGH